MVPIGGGEQSVQDGPPSDTAYEYNYPHSLQLPLHGLSPEYIYSLSPRVVPGSSCTFHPSNLFPIPTEP